MGSSSSKFRKHLQAGDEVQALQLYRANSELRKALDPNCSYGDSHQHETPLHLAAKHGMQTLLGIFLFSKGGNPKKTNARKETCLHCVCIETTTQSVHVDKRRADCLNYLLKWRGTTFAEGQVEKVDLAAQDEKLNTALHYAASSGLTQCVEILIQHGAPLFIENDEHLTPCDTAEKSGHARIALYLESKMVFSNDEEPRGEEDDVSMPPVEEYSGLRPQDLQEAKDHLLVETADMLSVPLFTAEALLRNHEWSREMLLESWMNDPIACCEKSGVTPPSTLFSEKPEVQENLASPLPSPLHTSPSPQDAECNICANTFLIADEPVHMTCTHQFCQECWERYLNVKIQEGDAHRITCPAYDCTMLVPIDIIERIVSRDMALRYLQFDIKAFVDSNPDMKWCPYPGCGRAVKLPDLDLGSNQGIKRNKIPSDTSRGVDCGVGHYFCWECLEESHEPCSCENWNRWFQKINEIKPETLDGTEQETELAANCLWLVTNSKPCPNCKSPIQKNEGCNHMKCSKCKYDFCWVCLEQWKRHNSSTGGYFKCNRYEVLKKVEEQCAQMVSEAEIKSRNMQELNRFVHYYTRFKNHENSYKLEEPLLKTVKDKMMKLAEAVTDNVTAHAETKFVEDAVQQLLKARRVLKCSYVYGFYLDGPGYKKIVFEFMQTELEECTEILSQMVNRLYLRTPRRKIMDQAHFVQRKRLEFIMAISKGLVPPETPPSVRKSKMKRKISGGEADDEDLHRAIVASIQEIDPSNPWIKDASGRHTNVVALLEWPSDESDQSEGESDLRAARESIGKCHRSGCNKVRVKNPRTNEHHDYCSRWCMQVDKEDQNRKDTEGLSEIVLDEHMELLRALEMSRLQYLRDNGLLHVSDSRDIQQQTPVSKATKTRGQSHKYRPRSNSAGQEGKSTNKALGLDAMKELGIELQRFHELSSGFPRGERDDACSEKKRSTKSKSHNYLKLSQSSRFDECRSTIVTRVPNKSVEDLYCLDQASRSSKPEPSQSQEQFDETPGSARPSLSDNDGTIAASLSLEALCGETSSASKAMIQLPPELCLAATDEAHLSFGSSTVKGPELSGSMFGVIKDICVSNIHSSESDKTKDFLSKDLALIFSSWDSGERAQCEDSINRSCARRPLTLENCPSPSEKVPSRKTASGECLISDVAVRMGGRKSGESRPWSWLPDSHQGGHAEFDGSISDEENVHSICRVMELEDLSADNEKFDRDESETLLEIVEDPLQITEDDYTEAMKGKKGLYDLGMADDYDVSVGTERLRIMGLSSLVSREDVFEKHTRSVDTSAGGGQNMQQSYESISNTQESRGKEKVTSRDTTLINLPRTAWSSVDNEEDTLTKFSPAVSKTNRKCSSQKTKVFNFDGAHRKSPRKIASKSKKSKAGPVAVGLMHGLDGRVYEVAGNIRSGSEVQSISQCTGLRQSIDTEVQSISQCTGLRQSIDTEVQSISQCTGLRQNLDTEVQSISQCTGLRQSIDTALEPSLLHGQSQILECSSSNVLLSEDQPCQAKSCVDDIDVVTFDTDVIDSNLIHESSNVNISDVGESESSSPLLSTTYIPGDVHTSAQVSPSVITEAARDESMEPSDYLEENCVEYTLSRNIFCDALSDTSGSQVLDSRLQLKTLDTEIVADSIDDDNIIATSALITDAYETAASDDVWEDASCVLPSDDRQSVSTDQDCEQEDDTNVFSLYV